MSQLTIASKSIHQLDGLYSLNDVQKSSGGAEKHQPYKFIRLSQTKELITEIENSPDLASLAVNKTTGRNGGTYACKELVYAYAMWISPKFHLHVIRAFDGLTGDTRKQLPPPDPDDVVLPREYVELLYKRINEATTQYNELAGAFNNFHRTFTETHKTFIRLNAINELLTVSKI